MVGRVGYLVFRIYLKEYWIMRINRKIFTIIAVLASASASASMALANGSSNESRPNILVLYGDDLGYGDLGCYNPDSKIPTSNLDRLSSEGMRFTDGHSSSGICTPSRYALLTGRHHWRKFHGIVTQFGPSAFDASQLTLPEMLKTKNYNTAAIGKWHLGWNWEAIRKNPSAREEKGKPVETPESYDWAKSIPDGPLDHGFDYYFGDTVINFPPYCWIENDKVVNAPDTMMDTSKWKEIKEGNWECRPGPMASDWDPYENIPTTTRKGVEYIKAQAKEKNPFFLYFAYPAPHAPIIPNDEFDGKSKAGPFGDFVYEVDDSIGQLLKALKQSGQSENTLVIFTADNGPEAYAYARDAKYGHWSAHPLRGLKRDIYEGGHRVPYIVKWPGNVQAGETSDDLVSQIDIMATVASVVGYELPNDQAEDSFDLLPLITDKSDLGPRKTHIHNTYADKYAIRDGDWLLVDTSSGYSRKKIHEPWEAKRGYEGEGDRGAFLYNLKKDIGQKRNLLDTNPEKAKDLKALLEKIREQGYSAPRLESQ
jgi:arylsulfatase A